MAAPIESITISDFTPGIFSRESTRKALVGTARESVDSGSQPGAATIDGTWGCTADATGALVPLPEAKLEESSTGVKPGSEHLTFVDDGLNANYLLAASFGGAQGDFTAFNSLPDDHYDILVPDRGPYQTLYTAWSVTVRDPDDPNISDPEDPDDPGIELAAAVVATHGWYKFRQARVVESIGAYHTYFWLTEDMWGDGSSGGPSSKLPRLFPYVGLVDMRTNLWGKPDYGTRWPMFNGGTFRRAMIGVFEGIRIVGGGDCYNGEPIPGAFMRAYYYADADDRNWFYPGSSYPQATWPNALFTWATQSHTSIIGHYSAEYANGNFVGVNLFESYDGDGEGTGTPGGWSCHYRDQSAASFFGSSPFRIRHAVHHHGRLVMISRHESTSTDELLLYSDWLAPLQYMDEANDDERHWGWDVRFYPPVTADFPNIDIKWDMLPWLPDDLATPPPAFYPERTSSRSYNLLLPGDDSLENTCSMGTAPDGQLFLIKAQGGGVLISGDLDNPTVRVNPNVEPTYGVESSGVHTPLGYVYGSRTGVYAWNGGDASVHLSPQLEGFFWEHATEDETDRYLGASRGNFAYWDNKILCPNDYLFNTETGGWWRLEQHGSELDPDDPDSGPDDLRTHIPYNRFDTDMDGRLWAFSYKVVPENIGFAYSYATDTLRDSYSWHSQPLVQSDDHMLSIQDIELVVTPTTGTEITVTVEGLTYDAANSTLPGHLNATRVERSLTFSLGHVTEAIDENRPILVRQDIGTNFTATQVSLRIEASGTDVAPRVHGISAGVSKRTRIPRLGSRAF